MSFYIDFPTNKKSQLQKGGKSQLIALPKNKISLRVYNLQDYFKPCTIISNSVWLFITMACNKREVEERGAQGESRPKFEHTVYIFGDSHARDQAAHLNASLKGRYTVKSTCFPGWPLNEVVEIAIAQLDRFVTFGLADFIVIVGGSNDTSDAHQKKLHDLYTTLFSALPNTNIIVCETPLRFDIIEKNREIVKTNIMVAQLCSVYPNVIFLPMINAMQRHHFTGHGLHMKHSGKRILSGLISNCIKQRVLDLYNSRTEKSK